MSKARGEDDVNRKPSPEEAAWQWFPAEVHSKPSPMQGPILLSRTTGDFYDPLYGGLCCFVLTTYHSNSVTELKTATSYLHCLSREERRACYDCYIFYLEDLLLKI